MARHLRGSCLTGRYPFRFGILAAHTGGMRVGEVTIAEALQGKGYATGFFGKWHMGWLRPDEEEIDDLVPEDHLYCSSCCGSGALLSKSLCLCDVCGGVGFVPIAPLFAF